MAKAPAAPPRRRTASDDLQILFDDLVPLLKIDKHAMDTECEEHAENYYRVSEALSLAISRRDEQSTIIKEIDADIDADLRETAERNKEKITEAAIRTAVIRDDEMQTAKRELNKLSSWVGRLGALKESFGQRSYMLTNLTTLVVSNYFSSNVGTPRGSAREIPSRPLATPPRRAVPRN